MIKNILITGAGGYLGSQLCYALSKDYNVIGVDNLLFNQGCLVYPSLRQTSFNKTTVSSLDKNLLKTIDCVFHFSCLTGMPICANNVKLAKQTNLDDIIELLSKLKPDCKFFFPSTNSGYGQCKEIATEKTPLNSISLYGKLKEEAEQKILNRGNCVIFRFATVFGMSNRMRLDLLANTLTYDAFFQGAISIFDNKFMRNYVHIHDITRCMLFSLNNFNCMKDNIFNVGNDKINCSKMDLVRQIQKHIPNVKVSTIDKTDIDQRDYIVSSNKIYSLGWQPQYDLDYGINELIHYYSFLPKDKTARELVTQSMRNDKFQG